MSKEGAILARNLKRIAEERNLTQREMAEICDLHESEMSKIFKNKQYPRTPRLIRMAAALNVELKDLVT